ncbi:hypothetical protein F5Y13DRAFT_13556 [Hypoxylon sp. FL1857]|nr:hypothetical protein F5Y13DRAFT_13556 [Hypoxylon sp. FL1857]
MWNKILEDLPASVYDHVVRQWLCGLLDSRSDRLDSTQVELIFFATWSVQLIFVSPDPSCRPTSPCPQVYRFCRPKGMAGCWIPDGVHIACAHDAPETRSSREQTSGLKSVAKGNPPTMPTPTSFNFHTWPPYFFFLTCIRDPSPPFSLPPFSIYNHIAASTRSCVVDPRDSQEAVTNAENGPSQCGFHIPNDNIGFAILGNCSIRAT